MLLFHKARFYQNNSRSVLQTSHDLILWRFLSFQGMTGAASEVPALWDMDSADYYECDCPGPPPPPQFRLPPPPRPPPEFLSDVIGGGAMGSDCNVSTLDELETCDMIKPVSTTLYVS